MSSYEEIEYDAIEDEYIDRLEANHHLHNRWDVNDDEARECPRCEYEREEDAAQAFYESLEQ